ncbi:hypothetical protein TacPo2_35 [Pantoea bacteriophage TacPo2]
MTLKVLPNNLQHWLECPWLDFKYRKSGDFDPDSDALLNSVVGDARYAQRIEPRFNRVGHYLDGKSCWYEWKLPSGRIVATVDDVEMFKYLMNLKNAAEQPPTQEEIAAVNLLIKNGRIKRTPDWIKYGMDVHDHRRMKIDAHKHSKAFSQRIKDAKPD